MDFPTGNIKRIYFRYLSAAFGSAMITSVYSIVGMAMVGQYHGPDGTAAVAVVAPVWNIIYSLGLLMGIGGSVIFSAKRGAEQNNGEENQYFTMAVLGSVLLAVLAWVGVLAFEVSVLTFFGADETLLAMAQRYMQPIISTNFGAGKGDRIRETLRLALGTAIFFGLFWTVVSMACPNLYVRTFMQPTQRILEIAPAIIRLYAISFLFLPLNIFSTYYFQAIMKPKAAFVVSVAHGCVISGILILLLPVLTGADSIWLAMPITELVVLLYALTTMKRMTKALTR